MLRSLFSGVSGMKSQQTKMDVIGNNIANVNTTAFKGQRVTFKDALSQTMQGASAPSEGMGGTNPKQVGLGVTVASIDTDMSQGFLQPTGRAADLAIEGNGFFIVCKTDANDSKKTLDTRFTRDGSFTLDKNGSLVTSSGYHVRGYFNSNYIPATDKYETYQDNILLPLEVLSPVKGGGFTFVLTKGNSINQIILNQGTPASVNFDNVSGALTITGNFNSAPNLIQVDQIQAMINSTLKAANIDQNVFVGGTADVKSFNEIPASANGIIGDNLNQYLAQEKVQKLTEYSIETDGTIKAVYGDGTVKLGQLLLANFQNPAGLNKMSGNTYTESPNSGTPQYGKPNDIGGTIQQGFLEMSRVDLANEFTEMIITSRAFQANSRTITTSDEMLQELLNLKR